MEYWTLSDRGKVRKENQDCFAVEELRSIDGNPILAAVVCDGMGGAKAGSVASRMAADTFLRELRTGTAEPEQTDVRLLFAANEANRLINLRASEDPKCEGMGTTMVAAVTDGKRLTVANVGDSRCYLVRSGSIRQLTKDHSVVEDMVDRGEIERAEAWKHPRRNYITRALGAEETVLCDLFHHQLEEGDRILLCTDGLCGVVNPQELLFEIVYGGPTETAVRRMADIALERGAPDNLTAVLIACGPAIPPADDEQAEVLANG